MKPVTRGMTLLLGVIAALITMIVPTTAAHATVNDAPTPGVVYHLRNFSQFECLAGRTNDRVDVAHCESAFNDQDWRLEPVAVPGYFRLRGMRTGKCMAIISNGHVRMSNCVDSFSDQWWAPEALALSSQFLLVNFLRGTCLAAPTINGPATSFTCTPTFTDQWWAFEPR